MTHHYASIRIMTVKNVKIDFTHSLAKQGIQNSNFFNLDKSFGIYISLLFISNKSTKNCLCFLKYMQVMVKQWIKWVSQCTVAHCSTHTPLGLAHSSTFFLSK